MAKRLVSTVHVHLEDEGRTVVYGPDDDVPADHAKLITNPKAWADDEEPDEAPKSRRGRS